MEHDQSKGETTCSGCGLVLDESPLVSLPRFDSYGSSMGNRLAPTGRNIPYGGLGTPARLGERDHAGRHVGPEISRLARLAPTLRVRDGRQRSLAAFTASASRYCSLLGLGSASREEAITLYRRITSKVAKAPPHDYCAAACLYIVCRLSREPVTLQEVVRRTGLREKIVGRMVRRLCDIANIKLPPPDALALAVARLPEVGLGTAGATFVRAVLSSKEKVGDQKEALVNPTGFGYSPNTVAAGTVYLAGLVARRPVSQELVARAFGVTEVSVRSSYRAVARMPAAASAAKAFPEGELIVATIADGATLPPSLTAQGRA